MKRAAPGLILGRPIAEKSQLLSGQARAIPSVAPGPKAAWHFAHPGQRFSSLHPP